MIVGIITSVIVGVLVARRMHRATAEHEPRAMRLLAAGDTTPLTRCECRYGVQRRIPVSVFGKVDPHRWFCDACGMDAPIVSLPIPGPPRRVSG